MDDATSERLEGPTPAGGAYAICYFAHDGQPVPRRFANQMTIVEFDAGGQVVHTTVGRCTPEEALPTVASLRRQQRRWWHRRRHPQTSDAASPSLTGAAAAAAHLAARLRTDAGADAPGMEVRRVLAQVDRTVVACVDIAMALWALDGDDGAAYDEDLGRSDVAAVSEVVTDLVSKSGPGLVLDRLAQWTLAARGFDRVTSQRTHRQLLLGRQAATVDNLMASLTFAPADTASLARRWADLVAAGDASVTDAFWTGAFLLSEAASDPFEADSSSSLVAVLGAACDRLAVEPHSAWSRALAGSGPPRRRCYHLRTLFDAGSGVLIWAGNQAARERFDYAVAHSGLPISKGLADAIDRLVARYDEGSGLLTSDSRLFTEDEQEVFKLSYFAVVDELAWQLGSAYQVHEESHFGKPDDRKS